MPLSIPRPLVLFLVLAATGAWLCATMPVFSQEAYYWTYAQHPDLSYFDHPPMVAWLIWLGTAVFGDGAFGLRLGTWACGLATTWFGLLLLREFGIDRRGQSLWIFLGLASPILTITRCLANPDPPLVCFWTLTLLALWRARSGSLAWWVVAGVAAGAALLSKYSAAFLAVGGLCMLLFDVPMRAQLRRAGPYLAVLISALVFAPVVIWNAQRDFESFRFQTSQRLEQARFGFDWFVELLAGQFILIHPVLAVLLLVAGSSLLKRVGTGRTRDPRVLLLAAFGLPLPLYMLVNSLWIQVKINWIAPAYVPLMLGLVVWWCERTVVVAHPRLERLIAQSLLLMPLALPLAPLIRLIPPGRGSSWTGWDEIAQRAEHWEEIVDAEDGIEGNVFFFAADYKDAAQLGRCLKLLWREAAEHERIRASPDRGEPTLAQNVIGMVALQFDHWDAPKSHLGQNAVFVLPRPREREAMLERTRLDFVQTKHINRQCHGQRCDTRTDQNQSLFVWVIWRRCRECWSLRFFGDGLIAFAFRGRLLAQGEVSFRKSWVRTRPRVQAH